MRTLVSGVTMVESTHGRATVGLGIGTLFAKVPADL